MQLLAMDIGGTYSRLAHCQVDDREHYRVLSTCTFATPTQATDGLGTLLALLADNKPGDFLLPHEYDALALAIAGPVTGRAATPPNINWALDLADYTDLPTSFLLNDFAAQGYALAQPAQLQQCQRIRDCDPVSAPVAIIGAGSGLGHCLLIPTAGTFNVLPSEAGQAGFVFNADEQELEAFFLKRVQQDYVTNDQVVSGPGLQTLHTALTGHDIDAAGICAEPDKNKNTLRLFSRFYGRACRQYCLSSLARGGLIISGGLAARNPVLIRSNEFLAEFEASPTHRSLLETIPISLNTDQDLGLTGIILYALSRYYS